MHFKHNTTSIKPRARYNHQFGVRFVRYPNSCYGNGGVGGDLDSALNLAYVHHHEQNQKSRDKSPSA